MRRKRTDHKPPPPPPPIKKDGYTGDAPQQNTGGPPPAPPSKDDKAQYEDKDAEIARVLSELGDMPADETEMPDDISEHIMSTNDKAGVDISLWGGDMALTTKQEYEQITGHTIQGDLVADEGLYWDDKRRDPSGKWTHIIVIPYRYASNVNPKYRTAMNGAVQEYNTKTCIRFVPETSLLRTPKYTLNMIAAGGCWSSVGRTGNRYQKVSLGNGCEYKGIAIHELMHAIGYYHEQSRPDRDKYVQILTANINLKMIYNFAIAKSIPQGTAYDYNSVMHYGEFAFNRNGLPTIKRLRGTGKLGQRKGLSSIDAISINKIYCNGENGGGGGGGGGGVTKPDICGLPTDSAFCSKIDNTGLCISCSLQKACPAQCGVVVDRSHNCPLWAKAGYCKGTFAATVRPICLKSCGMATSCSTCGSPTDTAFCGLVKTAGLCTSCELQKSCPTECGISTDKSRNCKLWASRGYCKRTYVAYMRANCATSCGDIKTKNCS